MTSKPTILSGIQSSGKLHIGNYLGAMNQFVALQESHDCYFFVADLHSLTTVNDRETLQNQIREAVAGYLAVGLDPQKVTLFRQSDIPYHTELAWIFECITTMPYLMRAHAYKDAEAKSKDINVGLFNYPMLMAADILLYQPDRVPVGADQKQHIEIARDTAIKFNNTFGETFKLPEPLILSNVAVVPGTDGRKMSKSYGNVIPLFGTEEEIRKAVMSIVTDSKSPEEPKSKDDTIYKIWTAVSADLITGGVAADKNLTLAKDFETKYENGGMSYKEAKEKLIDLIMGRFGHFRESYEENLADTEKLKSVLKDGAEKAAEKAKQTMDAVREKVGLNLK